jgi:RNA polymerase-associated protein LEO1
VNIESKPYDPEYYISQMDTEEVEIPLTGLAAKSRMIGVKNTIRWKWVKDSDGNYVSYLSLFLIYHSTRDRIRAGFS